MGGGSCAPGCLECGAYSVHESPVPGRPTVARWPFVPTVYQAPRVPTERLTPPLERLTRKPGIRRTRRLN